MIKPSRRSQGVSYAIRDVVVPARELEKKGHKVLKINIGDPNKYDFDTPKHIKDAVYQAALDGYNGYSPSEGEVDELSWVGGEKGFEVIETFLVEASKYLKEDGSILLVHSSLTKLKIDERDYRVEVLVEKELFFEKLVVVKLSHL